MMFRSLLSFVIMMYRFLLFVIIKGPPNDIYCIIEEPYKHYFTEKVSLLSKISVKYILFVINKRRYRL